MDINEKLLKFAGFTWQELTYDRGIKDMGWCYPNGERVIRVHGDKAIDFTSSLDACFAFLLRKNHSVDFKRIAHPKPDGDQWDVALWIIDETKTVTDEMYYSDAFFTGGKTPALALCKAIEKLIDQETPCTT